MGAALRRSWKYPHACGLIEFGRCAAPKSGGAIHALGRPCGVHIGFGFDDEEKVLVVTLDSGGCKNPRWLGGPGVAIIALVPICPSRKADGLHARDYAPCGKRLESPLCCSSWPSSSTACGCVKRRSASPGTRAGGAASNFSTTRSRSRGRGLA